MLFLFVVITKFLARTVRQEKENTDLRTGKGRNKIVLVCMQYRKPT